MEWRGDDAPRRRLDERGTAMKDLVTLIDLVQAWIDRTEADACTECKYFGTEEWEMPCAVDYIVEALKAVN